VSKKKKTRKTKKAKFQHQIQKGQKTLQVRIPKGDASFWKPFEKYNELDSKLRADALKDLGIEVSSESVLGQLTKSHFVIPGKTRYECRLCGECCRYARKVATFTYEPCPFLGDNNLCAKHDEHYQVCKWFPFWVYPDKLYGNLLTVKLYCAGYGHGELVDYEKTVTQLLKLRRSGTKEPDGAQVIHEVIYLPTRGEWVFPSKDNVDKLMTFLSKKTEASCTEGPPQEKCFSKSASQTNQLKYAHRYTSGLLSKKDDPNLTIDERGFITDVNEAACSLCGRPREAILGKKFCDLFVNPDGVLRDVLSCLSHGKVTAAPQRMLRPDDATIPVLLSAMVYRDSVDGLVHGALVTAKEISPSVFQEFTQSKHYARGLIEASLDALVVLDCDGVITDVNEAAVCITGCSRKELLGSQFKNYFDEPHRAQQGIEMTFEKNRVRDYELNLLNKSGELIPASFNATVYRDPDGIIQGIFASARDARDTQKMLRELEEAKHYARGLIEASSDIMVTLDRDGVITDVNEVTVRVTGCLREELIGAKFKSCFSNLASAEIGMQMTFEDGDIKDYELELRAKSGENIPVSFNAFLYRNLDGTVLGAFVVARVLPTKTEGVEKGQIPSGQWQVQDC